MAAHRLVHVHRGEARRVEAGEPHVADDDKLERIGRVAEALGERLAPLLGADVGLPVDRVGGRPCHDHLHLALVVGFGVNLVTGDFSRGASGLWIENGEFTFPVEEVTVAGNLKDMLNNIAEIGNDLEFRGSTACPTLRMEGLMVAGE